MKEFLVALIIVFVFAGIFLFPLCFIWSLNVLFPVLGIPYTFNTWLAAFCLLLLIGLRGGGSGIKIRSK